MTGVRQSQDRQQARVVRGVVAGEQVDLDPWLDPEVPMPGPVFPDMDGWSKIGGLGGWECTLSCFQAMEEVPNSHKEKWAKVVADLLRRVLDTPTEEARDRALLWFLVLPRLSFARPREAGGKDRTPLLWPGGLTT